MVKPIDLQKENKHRETWKLIQKNKMYYLIMLPGLLFFFIWHYIPMAGIIIAFKDIAPFQSVPEILAAPFVGFKHFAKFFSSHYFWNVLGNTLTISAYNIVFGFPAPIIFALLLNEIKSEKYKRSLQTVSYLPHFISTVVLAGLLTSLLSVNGGYINEIIKFFGGDPKFFLGDVKYFRGVLVVSKIWKDVGWGSIIYLAAISGIDPTLYEAAKLDGANKWHIMRYITFPSIMSIAIIMLILDVGKILNAGFETILLLYSESVYKVADIIDTYVYRMGIKNLNYSYSTAVGLFKSVVGFILVMGTDRIAKKCGQDGLL